MSQPTGNLTFDAALAAAEGVRQAAVAAASTQAAANAATKTYLQAVIAAGVANGIQCPNAQSALNAINSTGNP